MTYYVRDLLLYTCNGKNINVSPILCNTCVNVRIIIRLLYIIKVFMSKLQRMNGLFDWLSQYIQFIKLIVHLLWYYNVLIHIQRALSHRLVITPFVSSNPSYTTKDFINLFVKTNFKNVIFLNYALRQYIKGKKHAYI